MNEVRIVKYGIAHMRFWFIRHEEYIGENKSFFFLLVLMCLFLRRGIDSKTYFKSSVNGTWFYFWLLLVKYSTHIVFIIGIVASRMQNLIQLINFFNFRFWVKRRGYRFYNDVSFFFFYAENSFGVERIVQMWKGSFIPISICLDSVLI